MKTLTAALMIFSLFLLASCSKKEEAGQKPSGEIVKGYTKTLSTAPDKARDAGEASEKRDDRMTDAIKELDK